MKLTLRTVLPIAVGLVTLAVTGGDLVAADDPELAPTADARPHVVHRWVSTRGLRFTWVLPPGYQEGQKRNLVVILHGTGLDYSWGHLNNKPGVFCPDDIVVSVDGTSPGHGASRLFLGKPQDATAFKNFLAEMRDAFDVESTFLYGHSQGGFFVVYFAGAHPDWVDGVVAHASGAWSGSRTDKTVHAIAFSFMHGTSDPVVTFRNSLGTRDHFMKQKVPLLRLRRLERYNHWPNAIRATEEIAWCQGMTTNDPALALKSARQILEKKKPDEYQWSTTVGYSAARDILRRLQGKGPNPLKARKIQAAVKKEIARIDQAASRHLAALGKALGKKPRLSLDGRPWLGHLVSLREDFRGVRDIERFMKKIRYDALAASHAQAARPILDAWYKPNADPVTIYRTVIEHLPACFLYEGLPPELRKKMPEWKKDAESLGLTPRDLAGYAVFEAWNQGWDEGLDAYRGVWSGWK